VLIRPCVGTELRLIKKTILGGVHDEVLLVADCPLVGKDHVFHNGNLLADQCFAKNTSCGKLPIERVVVTRRIDAQQRSDQEFFFVFSTGVAQRDSSTLQLEIKRGLADGSVVFVDGNVIRGPWGSFNSDLVALGTSPK
jgi:hypothetical protein